MSTKAIQPKHIAVLTNSSKKKNFSAIESSIRRENPNAIVTSICVTKKMSKNIERIKLMRDRPSIMALDPTAVSKGQAQSYTKSIRQELGTVPTVVTIGQSIEGSKEVQNWREVATI